MLYKRMIKSLKKISSNENVITRKMTLEDRNGDVTNVLGKAPILLYFIDVKDTNRTTIRVSANFHADPFYRELLETVMPDQILPEDQYENKIEIKNILPLLFLEKININTSMNEIYAEMENDGYDINEDFHGSLTTAQDDVILADSEIIVSPNAPQKMIYIINEIFYELTGWRDFSGVGNFSSVAFIDREKIYKNKNEIRGVFENTYISPEDVQKLTDGIYDLITALNEIGEFVNKKQYLKDMEIIVPSLYESADFDYLQEELSQSDIVAGDIKSWYY